MQAAILRSTIAPAARASARITVEALRSVAEFAALAAEWNRLHEAAIGASVFTSWPWQYEWWRVYGASRRLNILAARAAGALVGVLPVYVETQATLGVPVRVARLLGSGGDTHPDDLGPFLAPAQELEASEALANALLRAGDWDAVSLEDMDSRLAFGRRLARSAAASALRIERFGRERIVYIDLPATWDAFLASLSANRRSKIRAQRKKLHQDLPARFQVWRDLSRIDAAFDRFVELHHERWRASGQQSESFGSPEYLAFHRAVMRTALPRGALRLYVLEAGGEPIAMLYALRFRRSVYVVQSAFDPAHSRLRPGHVLLGHAIQHAIEEGNTVFDFLRGEHGYKEQLATAERETEVVTAARETPGGRVWHLRHRVLPALKERLRPLARLVRLSR